MQDLLREADHHARSQKQALIGSTAVEAAIQARQRRIDRLSRKWQEAILRDTLKVATDGAHVGQVNGLSVVELGGAWFGHPTRITGNVRLGDGEVLDIQREADLGGAIHSKGVLICPPFCHPVCQQSARACPPAWCRADLWRGKDPPMAELCALLSALADAYHEPA
jgi:predicted ATP-dependent protease